jgi:hypothetical protein
MAIEKKKSRWVDAVSSMIELTQDGKLTWHVNANATTPYEQERTTSVFETTYNEQLLRLYQIRLPAEFSGVAARLFQQIQGGEPPKWFTKVRLEFVDVKGQVLWTFPEIDALSDLLTSVQYQVAGVKEFLDNIIGEAQGIPKALLSVPEFYLLPEFKKRGDALNNIIKIIDDTKLSEAERLKKAKAAAVDALLRPEF